MADIFVTKYRVAEKMEKAPPFVEGKGYVMLEPVAGGPDQAGTEHILIAPNNPNDLANFTVGDVLTVTISNP